MQEEMLPSRRAAWPAYWWQSNECRDGEDVDLGKCNWFVVMYIHTCIHIYIYVYVPAWRIVRGMLERDAALAIYNQMFVTDFMNLFMN
jgi:hypothetical protein